MLGEFGRLVIIFKEVLMEFVINSVSEELALVCAFTCKNYNIF